MSSFPCTKMKQPVGDDAPAGHVAAERPPPMAVTSGLVGHATGLLFMALAVCVAIWIASNTGMAAMTADYNDAKMNPPAVNETHLGLKTATNGTCPAIETTPTGASGAGGVGGHGQPGDWIAMHDRRAPHGGTNATQPDLTASEPLTHAAWFHCRTTYA